jgi:hypothetical protein
MPTPPAEPYVDLQSGETSGTISSGNPFSWYNSTAGSCTVSDVSDWCTASSYGPISSGASASATVKSGIASGDYDFTCPCCQAGQPSVHVSPGHIPPGAPKRNR